ncbi:MAG: hypothetical protein NTV42_08085 [Chloroflexi bacterium]|nr:hypothetical protein [Chloroflexota bacterium]
MSLSPDYKLAEVSQSLFHRDKYLCRATIEHRGMATHRDLSNWGNRDISVSASVGGGEGGGVESAESVEVLDPAPEEVNDADLMEEVVDPNLVVEVVDQKLTEEVMDQNLTEEVMDQNLTEEVMDQNLAVEVMYPNPVEEVVDPNLKVEVTDPKVQIEWLASKLGAQEQTAAA